MTEIPVIFACFGYIFILFGCAYDFNGAESVLCWSYFLLQLRI